MLDKFRRASCDARVAKYFQLLERDGDDVAFVFQREFGVEDLVVAAVLGDVDWRGALPPVPVAQEFAADVRDDNGPDAADGHVARVYVNCFRVHEGFRERNDLIGAMIHHVDDDRPPALSLVRGRCDEVASTGENEH